MATNQQLRNRLANVRNPYGNQAAVLPPTQDMRGARDLQLQQTVAQMAPQQAGAQLAQQIGGSLQQLANQQRTQQIQKQASTLQNIGQLGLQTQGLQAQQGLADLGRQADREQFEGAIRLAQLSEQAKQEVYDLRRAFAADQAGTKFTNERQLADYTAATAKSAEQLKDYQQRAEIALDRKRQASEAALSKIQAQLVFENQQRNQLLDQASQYSESSRQAQVNRDLTKQRDAQIERLEKARQELEVSVKQAQADAQAAISRAGTIGTILGAGAGVAIGGPVGGLIGSQVGS